MLAGRFRFHGHGSLKFLHKNAATSRSRYFTVKAIANPRRQHSRFAVIVSKKVHKSAVGRNRIRRRTYEMLRQIQPHLPETTDIAVIVSTGEVINAPYEDIWDTLQAQLKELNVYRE